MTKEYNKRLSKDLPGGRVAVPEGSEKRSYYKYYLEPVEDLSDELKTKIRSGIFEKGQGLEIDNRTRLQEISAYPSKPGYYPLRGGGVVTCANVKTPDLDAEMFGWWASWHGIDPLRYAIWDNQDHYDLKIIKNKERLLESEIPAGERIWTTEHAILESMVGDEPQNLWMHFLSPWECGYDRSLEGTDRWLYGICAEAKMGEKIPVFATEVLVKGEDGVNEIRCRFWIGYERQSDGTFQCKLPPFVKIPEEVAHKLVMHNYKEFTHLNKILPSLYEEEKDHWE